MPVIDNKSIKTVSALLLKIEAEIRDIRQRLDEVERSISIMNQTNLATSPNLIQIAQEIESEVKEVVAILKPINLDEVDPLEILAIPEIPLKLRTLKRL
jgi:archaellum component FlaC